MGLTVYLSVYPQPCPLGVCNPQLDTSMTIHTLCSNQITERRIYAIESGGFVITW